MRYRHKITRAIYRKSTVPNSNSYWDVCNEIEIPASIIESRNDWERVDEPYQILSFKQDGDCTDLWTEHGKGWCRTGHFGQAVTFPYTYEAILETKIYKIHSVKRIYDGKVFTVGDTIQLNNEDPKKLFVISKIILLNGTTLMFDCIWEYRGGHMSSCTCKIEQLVPLECLYITDDGIKVKDKDMIVYSVCEKSGWETRESSYTKYGGALHGTAFKPQNPWRHFSTPELRDEYIFQNKPLLSYREIMLIYDNAIVTNFVNDLSKITQTKIKGVS